MPSRITSLLKQPYPSALNHRRPVALAVGSGLFVALFLTVFQPFGLHQWTSPYKFPVLLGYGAVTTAGTLLLELSGRRLPSVFAEERWTVGKHIAWVTFHLFTIGLGNTLYSSWLGFIPFSPAGFVRFGFITLAVGIFPIAAGTILHYLRQLRQHVARAETVNQALPDHRTETAGRHADDVLELVAENGKDRVRLPTNALLFIESSDNYATLWVNQEGKVRKELIRSSLGRLENQLPYPYLRRCHRSYIVNLRNVQSVSGNAQGYKLHFALLDGPVPVARQYRHILQQLPVHG
ncbi:MAG: response regulator transcription factor [Ferruginibacter sp.]|nr:response regulator transcription factor [Cytophagales bacterium]